MRSRSALDNEIPDTETPTPARFAPKTESTPGVAERNRLRRRQLSHDIHHELGTIMLLASLLSTAPDAGEESRKRARQILGEARWLDQLQRAYEEHVPDVDDHDEPATTQPIRLDLMAQEVVDAMRLCTVTEISLTSSEAWALADRLAVWRALRNVLDNALRAAGANGRVEVRVFGHEGWSVAEVDDNGPGFGAIEPGLASLGLRIVQDVATAWAGQLEYRRSSLGGCCVRLRLPAVPPGPSGSR
ncbi:sensor histidine kinase [Dactylosporangium fulvum]|uniref:histidine kinase n=1 Tax=Dactylosporangium fulvum TaxID=53359 RepID=A0ABY5W8E9_9ACTN|nr:sensor histidine kinase [Dactylosporangium fulvum]UWP85489.1 sensor histidine kinase [Dactylosporangium fulvum]